MSQHSDEEAIAAKMWWYGQLSTVEQMGYSCIGIVRTIDDLVRLWRTKQAEQGTAIQVSQKDSTAHA